MELVELISKIVDISHSNIDLDARINGILKLIQKYVEASDISIYILDKDKRLTLKYAVQNSLVTNLLSSYRPLLGEGVPGLVAQKREPHFYSIHNIPKRFGLLLQTELDNVLSNYRRFAFLPLCDESKCYGVLLVFSSVGSLFTDNEKKLFDIAARELTGLRKLGELYIYSSKRITELMTLSEIGKVLISSQDMDSILKGIGLIVAKTLGADFARVVLKEKNGDKHLLSAEYGGVSNEVKSEIKRIEKLVVEQGKRFSNIPVLENSLVYSSPIVSKGQVLGVISVVKRNDGTANSDDNGFYLLDTISNYLSSGLENIILRSQLKDIIDELNSAQERIIQQEKLRSLGEMTANIAHEIKNPLVIIGGFAKRLAKKLELKPPERRYLNIILREVGRLESILTEILTYAKDIPLNRTSVDIDEILTDLIHFFKSDPLWENVEFAKESEARLPRVFCDPQQIKQVFINILVNAYEAMAGEGKIKVRIFPKEILKKHYVGVAISDTGGGIDPLIIDNIFNPFFTTKERGTGLGLSISNKIVLSHRGKIEVENQRGVGATFIVYLPVCDDSTCVHQNDKMPRTQGEDT
ncbi:MAG: ATP-binding protein [Deltaproteobacteria bacterium]|nr:ATP-binding protein [Deltaproteobacteria bacterium]